MEKVKALFRKINEKLAYQVVVCVVAGVCLLALYVFLMQKIDTKKIKELSVSEDTQIMVEIEDIAKESGELQLTGWGLRLGARNEEVYLALQAVGAEEPVLLDTNTYVYTEPGEYYMPEWDFGECGFEGRVKESTLNKDVCYEVLMVLDYAIESEKNGKIQTEERRVKISTEQYLYNGELYRYNPEEFWAPELEDVAVQEAIETGMLLCYDLEREVWVYEKEGILYFVANYEALGELSPGPSVPLRMYTIHNECKEGDAPEHYLTSEECQAKGEKKYYSYAFSMERDYPLTYFQIGVWGNVGEARGWLWRMNGKFDRLAFD